MPNALINTLILLALTLSGVVKACEITVLGNENKFPKVYLEDGEAKGILVDMMRYVSKEVDCDFYYRLSSWKRAYVDMQRGMGIIIGLSKTSERMKTVNYSEAMYSDEILIITHKDNPFVFNDIEDLSGKRIAFSRGASYGDEFDKALNEGWFAAFEDNGDIASRIKLLLYDRIDAALVGPGKTSVYRAINNDQYLKINQNKLHILPKPLKQDFNYIGFTKGSFSDALLHKIDQSILKGRSSGAFGEIEDDYAE